MSVEGKPIRKSRLYIWQFSTNGSWFWQLNGSNGRPVMRCPGNGFSSKRNANNGFLAAYNSIIAGKEGMVVVEKVPHNVVVEA